MKPTKPFEIVPAATFGDAELAALFAAVYADYFVPVHVDEAALRLMVRRFDLDLEASRVLVEAGEPVAIALLGVRGSRGWIGGMGVAPGARRAGHGRRVMEGVIAQARLRGLRSVGLEVLEQNAPAIALYRDMGFRDWRMLDVWAHAGPLPTSGAREIPAADARAWIAQRRTTPEPWQRADASLDRFDLPEHPLRGLEVTSNGKRTGATVALATPERASLLQMAVEGPDARGVARALCAGVSAWAPVLRFLNVPGDHPASAVLAEAGATLDARQFEMTLELARGVGATGTGAA